MITIKSSKSQRKETNGLTKLLENFIPSTNTEQKFRYRQKVYRILKQPDGKIHICNSKGILIQEFTSSFGLFFGNFSLFNKMKESHTTP